MFFNVKEVNMTNVYNYFTVRVKDVISVKNVIAQKWTLMVSN